MLTGKWITVTDTPMGRVDLDFDFEVKGTTLSGSGMDGKNPITVIDGVAESDVFSFRIFLKTPLGMIPVDIMGKQDDDTHISGTAKCKLGNFKFSGKRK